MAWDKTLFLSTLLLLHFTASSIPRRSNYTDQALSWLHNRPSEAAYMLPHRNRDLGILYMGATERARMVVHKMINGGGLIRIGFVGGSCTEGGGITADDRWKIWPIRLTTWLQTTFNGTTFEAFNGAKGGTKSSYMALCLHEHVKNDTDILFIEYAVNDPDRLSDPPLPIHERAPFEVLLRRALMLPHRPAVIILNSYRWTGVKDNDKGSYLNSAETDFLEFGSYYHLPTLSLRSAAYHLMRTGAHGFKIDNMLGQPREGMFNDSFFFPDGVHPLGATGHRVYAELAFHFILQVAWSLLNHPLHERQERNASTAELPPPMLPGNWEPVSPSCFFSDKFQKLVAGAKGFEWVNDAEAHRAKWGYKADQPGAEITVALDIVGVLHPDIVQAAMLGAKKASSRRGPQITVQVVFLKSYDRMGRARVECSGGCECNHKALLEGWHSDKTSLITEADVPVSSLIDLEGGRLDRTPCSVKLTVSNESSSDGHRFKVVGVVLTTGFTSTYNNHALDFLVKDSWFPSWWATIT